MWGSKTFDSLFKTSEIGDWGKTSPYPQGARIGNFENIQGITCSVIEFRSFLPLKTVEWFIHSEKIMNRLLSIALLFISLVSFAEEKSQDEMETSFSAMLKNSYLRGTWVPVKGDDTESEKGDSYQVVRATKIKGDSWEIVSRTNYQGKEIEFPIPVIIKWAGDTAVMILDEIPTAGGKKYSARVMFHKDRYAGSWWGKNQPGGLLSGIITQQE